MNPSVNYVLWMMVVMVMSWCRFTDCSECVALVGMLMAGVWVSKWVSEWVSESCSVVSDSETPWAVPARLLCPWNFPGKNTEVDRHSLLQGIFATQGSNLGLPHCGRILYHLSHQGSPVDGGRGEQLCKYRSREHVGTLCTFVSIFSEPKTALKYK